MSQFLSRTYVTTMGFELTTACLEGRRSIPSLLGIKKHLVKGASYHTIRIRLSYQPVMIIHLCFIKSAIETWESYICVMSSKSKHFFIVDSC
ncbi:hypothetical protein H9W95_15600 [Flavobacterium lindanitolerans]|nr:hypothetical protein [Flavobacterium lindanitolerans]